MTQILSGIYCLIAKNIYHRDLKPQNIMIKNGCIKLGDFGQSTKKFGNFYEKNKFTGKFGTPCYQSPQVINGEPYTSKN